MDSTKIIYCIGDSHVSFFSGYDSMQPCYPERSLNKYKQFITYRLGAVLAYSLGKKDTKEKGTELLFTLLDELPEESKLLLCFGEIDNRCHLLKQSVIQQKPLNDIVNNCVQSYFQVIDELLKRRFDILIFAALPSCESFNPEYPTYGTMEERNISTKMFNEKLKAGCLVRKISLINLFNYLTTKRGLTKTKYFFDGVHLGQIAFPFLLNEFSKNKNYKNLFTIRRYIIEYKMLVSRIKTRAKNKIRKIKNIIK